MEGCERHCRGVREKAGRQVREMCGQRGRDREKVKEREREGGGGEIAALRLEGSQHKAGL